MNKENNEPYGNKFYNLHNQGMSDSANIILKFLYSYFKPRSVIDVGCGQGAWLRVAESLGTETLKGLDGKWIEQSNFEGTKINFMPVDFEAPLPELDQKYDLCISLEVAEHVSEENAKNFVNLLCDASDTVLFGAAIKNQGGANHINEQWQSYWIELFKSNGYECIDCIRNNIWDNTSVEWWYKQNSFIFVNPEKTLVDIEKMKSLKKPINNIVHPQNYEAKVRSFRRQISHPDFEFCIRSFLRYIRNFFRK